MAYCASRVIAIDKDRVLDVDDILDDLKVPSVMTASEKKDILRVNDERLSFLLSLDEILMKRYSVLLIDLKKADVLFFNALMDKKEGCLGSGSFSKARDEYNKIISLCNELRYME